MSFCLEDLFMLNSWLIVAFQITSLAICSWRSMSKSYGYLHMALYHIGSNEEAGGHQYSLSSMPVAQEHAANGVNLSGANLRSEVRLATYPVYP